MVQFLKKLFSLPIIPKSNNDLAVNTQTPPRNYPTVTSTIYQYIQEQPMISSKIREVSPTLMASSLTATTSVDYSMKWCGTTESYFSCLSEKLDEKPLKVFLMRNFPWILDVTEVSYKNKAISSNNNPIQIHLTVSPIHHTELLNPKIERMIRNNLYDFLKPLIKCMYNDVDVDRSIIIFSPAESSSIMEYLNPKF